MECFGGARWDPTKLPADEDGWWPGNVRVTSTLQPGGVDLAREKGVMDGAEEGLDEGMDS
jgi:hypothetical protein